MKRMFAAAAIVMGSAALFSGSAFAGGATYSPVDPTSDFEVKLTVVDECTISTSDIQFDDVGIIVGAVNAAPATITVQCTHDTPYQIGLSKGAGADVGHRHMTGSGADVVKYNLYTDGTYAHIWGNTAGSDTVGNTSGATGADETHDVYAQIEAHQNVAADDYSDQITATIYYADTLNP